MCSNGEADARVWFSSGVDVWDAGLSGALAPSFRYSNLPCPEVSRPVHTVSTASTAQQSRALVLEAGSLGVKVWGSYKSFVWSLVVLTYRVHNPESL